MRVLIACEFSGIVRDAFIAQGHDAWSVDLIESERWGPHIIGDAVQVANEQPWDMMIAHPPCTYLAVSGARWMAGRQDKVLDALLFVRALLAAPIPMIALENPVSIISTLVAKPTQIVQPWQFGHPEAKTTCLWLNGLPKLVPTNVLPKPDRGYWDNQTPSGQNKLGPSPDRWKLRSATYPGLAAAMAQQWG